MLVTNILLYLLSGNTTVADFLDQKTLFVSFVTELEMLGYSGLNEDENAVVERLLQDCTIIDINSEIKRTVIEMRRTNKLRLPDAIIAATSKYLNIPLMTADKDLIKINGLNILFYEK